MFSWSHLKIESKSPQEKFLDFPIISMSYLYRLYVYLLKAFISDTVQLRTKLKADVSVTSLFLVGLFPANFSPLGLLPASLFPARSFPH